MSDTGQPLLQVHDLHKHFPGVQALAGVSLELGRGEVLAVVGENGAGKSTLMKILAGVHRPDIGRVVLAGSPVHFQTVKDALAAGIVLIHQELNLAENLSVAANLFLGHETVVGGPLGLLRGAAMDQQARQLLTRVGLSCSPSTRVDHLKMGQRQLVEIARAIGMQARILIMDEPTSSLTQSETDRLFGVVADLKRQGVSVIYISHRLAEVKQIADRVEVLRDGRNAGGLTREQISHDAMVSLMVGRDLKQLYPRQHAQQPARQVRLEVSNLVFSGASAPLSFSLRAGEVVGLAGLVGSGRTELAEALFGIRPVVAGSLRLDGRELRISNPRQAVARGLFLVPEDRRQHGLLLERGVRFNLSLPSLDRLSRFSLILPGKEKELAERMSQLLRVKSAGLEQPTGQLSGGNQQKIVLGKWLARNPAVLILDEPTRGVDVGARSEMYQLIDQLAATGVAVLMISSDMEEVLGMSDRLLVMHQGQLTGELTREQMTETAVMRLATGQRRGSAHNPDPTGGAA